MGVFYDFDEVDAFTVGAIGQPGSAHVLAPGPPRHHASHGEVREATGRGHRRLPAQACCSDLPAPTDQPHRRRRSS